MTAIVIGAALLFVAVCVFCYALRPAKRSSRRQRAEALRRYQRDIEADGTTRS